MSADQSLRERWHDCNCRWRCDSTVCKREGPATVPVKLRRRTPEERADYLERKLLEMISERTEAQDELDKVNAVLREHGFEYPLGARGVADAIGLFKARLDDPDFILAEAARLQRLTDG